MRAVWYARSAVIALCNALPSLANTREARNESAADCVKSTFTSSGALGLGYEIETSPMGAVLW